MKKIIILLVALALCGCETLTPRQKTILTATVTVLLIGWMSTQDYDGYNYHDQQKDKGWRPPCNTQKPGC